MLRRELIEGGKGVLQKLVTVIELEQSIGAEKLACWHHVAHAGRKVAKAVTDQQFARINFFIERTLSSKFMTSYYRLPFVSMLANNCDLI